GRPSPAMIVAIVALVAALGGSAVAARHQHRAKLGKNSVGTRQIKRKAVTTGKIARNAVNGAKVANGSLTGADINLGALGTVPRAAAAGSAGNADRLGGHAAACPSGSTLIRGLCFDSAPSGLLNGLAVAADTCAARGGFLPTPMQLYSIRSVVNLGSGIGNDKTFTDSYYYDATSGSNPSTVVIDGAGTVTQQPVGTPGRALCVYQLVR
ncbi:MAG TPA: hypothetical protein VFJ99_05960, partial [Solirubrobacterales bacterium]|nr:hypothetical protein [Solirubrobacterales bacterium]